jgi:cation-transporting ATPase 13A3/4/5
MQLQPINTAETDLSIPQNAIAEREYSVAVTGDAFRWLVDFGNEDVLNKVSRVCTRGLTISIIYRASN